MLPIKSVMLAETYDPLKDNVIGWYCSEKYDGIRCIFLHKQKKFVSRTDKEISVPKYFLDDLKNVNIDLDGELWTKRNDFQKISSIVRKKEPILEEWEQITYKIFDTCDPRFINSPFTERLNILKKELAYSKLTSLIPMTKITKLEDIDEQLNYYLNLGGEGLMLKDPNSIYEQKRSHKLLKVKPYDDADAIITDVKIGKGRLKDGIGSYVVRAIRKDNGSGPKEGSIFKVGIRSADRIPEEPIGRTLTYKYYGFTKSGLPRMPIFLRFID